MGKYLIGYRSQDFTHSNSDHLSLETVAEPGVARVVLNDFARKEVELRDMISHPGRKPLPGWLCRGSCVLRSALEFQPIVALGCCGGRITQHFVSARRQGLTIVFRCYTSTKCRAPHANALPGC